MRTSFPTDVPPHDGPIRINSTFDVYALITAARTDIRSAEEYLTAICALPGAEVLDSFRRWAYTSSRVVSINAAKRKGKLAAFTMPAQLPLAGFMALRPSIHDQVFLWEITALALRAHQGSHRGLACGNDVANYFRVGGGIVQMNLEEVPSDPTLVRSKFFYMSEALIADKRSLAVLSKGSRFIVSDRKA